MQHPCSTNERQRAIPSHPTTNEGSKQAFPDVCTSEAPEANHAAEPVARTGSRPQQPITAINAMRRERHLCTMCPHDNSKRSTRVVSSPHEGIPELSTYP